MRVATCPSARRTSRKGVQSTAPVFERESVSDILRKSVSASSLKPAGAGWDRVNLDVVEASKPKPSTRRCSRFRSVVSYG